MEREEDITKTINSEENKTPTNDDAYLPPLIDTAAASFDPDNNHHPSPTSALENPEQVAIAKALQFIIDAKTLQEKANKIAYLKTLGFIQNISYSNLKKLNEAACSVVKAGINENKIPTAETLCYEFLFDRLWELAPLDHVHFYHALGQLYLETNYYLEALPYLTRALEIIKTYEAFLVNENFQNSSTHKKLVFWLTHSTWEQEKQTLYHHVTQMETGYFSAQIFLLVTKEIAHPESLSPQQIEQLLKRLQPLFDGLAATEQWALLQEKYKPLQPLIHHYIDVYLLPALEKVQEKLKTDGKDLSDQDWFQTVLSIAKQWEVHHQYDYAKRCYQLLCSHLAEGETKTQLLMHLNRLEDYQASKSNPPLPAYTPQWSIHRQKLQTFRANFEKRFHDKQFSHYHLQNDYTQDIKQLLNSAINNIVKLLGAPPCIFHLVGIGSLSRGLSPYSDIELAMLIQDAQYKQHPYFQVLIALLDFHLKTLADPWAIAEGKKEWVGLHTDEGCLKKLLSTDPLLINTPANLADWVVTELSQPSQDYLYAYALLRPVSLYVYFVNDKKTHEVAKALIAQYSRALQQHLDPMSTDLDHEGTTQFIPPYQRIAISALDKHQQEFQERHQAKKNQQTKNLCQLKNDYLSPLLYLCFDLGLYLNVRDENRVLCSTVPDILSQVEATEPDAERLLTRLLTVYKALNRLRDAQQFLRGQQPDEVQLPAYFDPGQAQKEKDPALLADEMLPALTKEEQDYLNAIDQSLLQVICQDIHAFVNHLQAKRTSGLQKSFHTYPVSSLLLSNPSHHKNIVGPPGFFQLNKSKSENTLSFTSIMTSEVQLLAIEYQFQQKRCFKRLEQGMRRGQLHWSPQQSSLIKTQDALLNPAMAELKAILQKCYQDQPKIPLLLDETKTFALDEIFIDLELVEQKDKSKTDKTNSIDDTQSVEREDSLTAETRYELQTQIQERRKPITPEQLFLPLAEDNTSTTTIHRLYLQGAAGIGKTTLCRHLAYRWADPNNPLWVDQFTLVIYLPLRQVVRNYPERDSEYSLKKIILGNWSDMATLDQRTTEFNECFIQKQHKQALWEYIQDKERRHQILFLLDGLDEVDSNHPAIKGLLNSDICYLITSRPQVVPSQVQRSVENVGFTEASRNNYIQNFFKLMQQPAWAELMITWIKENAHLAGLSSIAINCELLCTRWYLQQLKAQLKSSTFKKNKEESNPLTPTAFNSQLTITELYAELILQWQKKALLRGGVLTLEKLREEYEEEAVKALCVNHCAEPLHILSQLSYEALCQEQGIIISGDSLKKIVKNTLQKKNQESGPDNYLALARKVLALGVLKREGLSKKLFEDQFDFAHLTFVEYLAAYYIAQGFEAPDNTPQRKVAKEALLQYQYHPKFEVMWWFVSGHLALMQGGGLRLFFTKLINGPQCLNGYGQYIQLFHCYEQAFAYAHLPKDFHDSFLQFIISLINQYFPVFRLEQCLKIVQVHEIQEDLLLKVRLQIRSESKQWWGVSQFLSTTYLAKLLPFLQQDLQEKDAQVRARVWLALQELWPQLTSEQVTAFLPHIQQGLEDNDAQVRAGVWWALMKIWPRLTSEQVMVFLSQLEQGLKDENAQVRARFWRVLGVLWPQLTSEQVTAFLPHIQQGLKDNDAQVRAGVWWALMKIWPRLTSEQAMAFLPQLEQGLEGNDAEVRDDVRKVLEELLLRLTSEQATAFLPHIQQGLKDENAQVRARFWRVLVGVLGPQLTSEQVTSFLPHIQQGLKDDDVQVHAGVWVLEALWPRLTSEQVMVFLSQLEQGLKDNDAQVRVGVWWVLKALWPQLTSEQVTAFLPHIQQGLEEEDARVRDCVWSALQELWPQLTSEQVTTFLPHIQQGLEDNDAQVRAGVWWALMKIWPRLTSEQVMVFLSQLEQGLKDNDAQVRVGVWSMLEVLGPQLTSEQVMVFLSQLEQGLKEDNDAQVRVGVWRVLKVLWPQLTSEQVTAFLPHIQGLEEEDARVRDCVWSALQELWPQLTSEQVTAFLPHIQQGLEDNDAQVRTSVWWALMKIWPRLTSEQVTAFLPHIQQGLEEGGCGGSSRFWRVLGVLWPQLTSEQVTAFLPHIQQGLEDNDAQVRERVWLALQELWPQLTSEQVTAFLSLIQQGLKEEDAGVRERVWKALEELWPRLTSKQLTMFLPLLQQGLQDIDRYTVVSVLNLFIVSDLPSLDAKKTVINVFIQQCSDKDFRREISREFDIIKYSPTTLHFWKNQTKVEFTVTTEQMVKLEEAFKEDRLDLMPLQKALQEDTPSLSQAPMTYFGNTLTRDDKDDSLSSTTIPKPGM